MHTKTRCLALLVVSCALLLTTACSKPAPEASTQPPKASPKPTANTASQPAAPAKTPAQGSGALFAYSASKVDATVGTEATAKLNVTPKPGFKINTEFPWKLVLDSVDGLEVKEGTLAKDKWTLDNKTAALSIPVTAKAAGDRKLTGKMTLSVCDDSRCEVLRNQEVAVQIVAK